MVERSDIGLGEEVKVQRRPQAGVVVSVRLPPEAAERLEQIAEVRGMIVSQVVREALLRYLGAGPMGALTAAPWTITTDAFSTVELTMSSYGAIARTSGRVEELSVAPQPQGSSPR